MERNDRPVPAAAQTAPEASKSLPYLPFARPALDEETIAAVADVLRSGWITTGPRTAEFESALSRYFGGRIVKTFTSATAALEVALLAAGIGPGDEVITTAMTFAASANVILRVGARPVFVDAELGSRNIDLRAAEAAITSRTRAIMPVHFAGRPVDMDALYALARKHGLRVIEDAAHAMGATWRGQRIGSFGDLVAFSFHPNKNMTTVEGGALVMSDQGEAAKADLHRFHGIFRDSEGGVDVELPGGKYNFSDVYAVIGLAQLARLEAFNARRRELAASYGEALQGTRELLLPEPGIEGHCWHIYTPLLALDQLRISRAQFVQRMHERGIGVGIHYPALTRLKLYDHPGYAPHPCPNAERIGRQTVTLPLFPGMKNADVERVCTALRAVLAEAGRDPAA